MVYLTNCPRTKQVEQIVAQPQTSFYMGDTPFERNIYKERQD